jgi:hypothetical protein
MAAYIASPLAPCSAPLGGLVASLDVSGGGLVVPAGIFSGSIISTMGGVGVQAGASTLNMRGLVVQGGHSSRKKGGPWQSRGYLCNQHFGSSHGLCQPTIILLGSRDPPLLPPSSLAWWFGDTSSLGGIWWLHGCRPFWVAPPPLVHWPDPDEKVSASPCSHHGSLLPPSDPGNLPFDRLPPLRAFGGLGIPPPLADLVALLVPPSLGCLPLRWSAGQIPISRCRPPLTPTMAPCSPRWWRYRPPCSPILASCSLPCFFWVIGEGALRGILR